nr:MAG TPA: hypothetical protein [Caudoviricetes sp.]DAM28753.1 MAG TPA: hypothetical protein [Caudoviricetes sp.]
MIRQGKRISPVFCLPKFRGEICLKCQGRGERPGLDLCRKCGDKREYCL